LGRARLAARGLRKSADPPASAAGRRFGAHISQLRQGINHSVADPVVVVLQMLAQFQDRAPLAPLGQRLHGGDAGVRVLVAQAQQQRLYPTTVAELQQPADG
jgi:hypothetical protein